MDYLYIALFVSGLFIGYGIALAARPKKKETLDDTIDELGKEIVLLEDIDKISYTVKSILSKHLDVSNISIVIYDDNKEGYRLTDTDKELDFQAYLPFFYNLEMNDRVVMVNDLMKDTGINKKVLQAAREYFKDINAKVAVPLIFERRLIGIVNLDRKKNGKDFNQSDFSFLTKLRNEMTVAFTNSLLFRRMSQLFEDVQGQNEKLMQMDKAKTSFWANVSHDLKTPVSTIKNYVEHLLTTGKLSTEEQISLREAFLNIKKLERLITSLLTFSQIDTGKMALHKEKTDIKDIILESLEEEEMEIQSKHLHVVKELDDCMVMADIGKIQQAVTNLLDNAVKFSEHGPLRIKCQKDERMCTIQVIDSGIGIPQDKQEQVFQRFIHLDTQEKGYKGIGLGLPIVKSLVQMHDGEVTLRSEVGKGTTVTIALPLENQKV